jgi:hypothetical protein
MAFLIDGEKNMLNLIIEQEKKTFSIIVNP